MLRQELRDQLRHDRRGLEQVRLTGSALPSVEGPAQYFTEPLGLALVDTVSRMAFADGVVVIDAAQRLHFPEMADWLEYLNSKQRRRQWDRIWNFADARSESPGESWSRVRLAELEFPPPELQRSITTDRGVFRTDFCWEQARVLGEFDGRIKYVEDEVLAGLDPREALYREKLREDALRQAGWQVVRWGWSELEHPKKLAARLQRAGLRPRSR